MNINETITLKAKPTYEEKVTVCSASVVASFYGENGRFQIMAVFFQ
ncbi:MAG: hypothetical protein ACP5H3_04220 [Candidatus Aenigmatarchaeota archaeon]